MTATSSTTLNELAYDLNGVVDCSPEQIAAMDAEAAGRGLVRVAPGVFVAKVTAEQQSEVVHEPGCSVRVGREWQTPNAHYETAPITGDLLDHVGNKIGSFRFTPGDSIQYSSVEFNADGGEYDITNDALNSECGVTDSDPAIVAWLIGTFPAADTESAEEDAAEAEREHDEAVERQREERAQELTEEREAYGYYR